jgi:hypothetical protein
VGRFESHDVGANVEKFEVVLGRSDLYGVARPSKPVAEKIKAIPCTPYFGDPKFEGAGPDPPEGGTQGL